MYDNFLRKVEVYKLYYEGENVNFKNLFKDCEKIIFPFNEFVDNDDNFNDLYKDSIMSILQQKLTRLQVVSSTKLRQLLFKFFEDYFDNNLFYSLKVNQVYFSYLLTIEDTLKKYEFNEAVERIEAFNDLFEIFIDINHFRKLFNIKATWLLLIMKEEYVKENLYLIDHFFTNFFSIFYEADITPERYKFLKDTAKTYIKIIGEKWYRKYFEFIKEDIIGTNRLYMERYFNKFVAQCDFYYVMDNDDFELVTKIFAENGFISNKCLLKLEEINSSYKDEYEAFILMKELKEA